MSELNNLYFWRQHLVLLAAMSLSISGGFMMAFPSVLNPSILAPNGTDIRVTMDEAASLAASTGIYAFPSYFILPIVMHHFGRKIMNYIVNIILLLGWVTFIFAKDSTALYFARMLHGLSLGSILLNCIILAEYAQPKRRGYFLVTKKLSTALGIFLCHLLYLWMTWRQIAGFNIFFNLLSILITIFLPETPSYLAIKKRFAECEKSYNWLNGTESSRKEFLDLIATQEDKVEDRRSTRDIVRTLVGKLLKKDFLNSFIITVLLLTIVETGGRHTFAAYLIQIMIELIGSNTVATYISVGNDLLSISGMIVAIVLVRHVNRRTLVFSFGGFSVILMFLISAILFFEPRYPTANLKWWSVSIILFFSFITNAGVIPLAFTLMGEVYALDVRETGSLVTGLTFGIIYSLSLKITPTMVKNTGLSGTFLINACITLPCLIILHFILPETKDKTLLDIEFEMKGKNKTRAEAKPML